MKPRHQVSKDAIELIKRFEGYRRASAQLPDGGYTIGYGHTKTARPGVEIDERDAEALLRYDLIGIAAVVNDLTFTPLTQNQFDALVCFCFNVGVENFRRSSVLRRVNEGNLLQAAAALEIWRKSDFEGERIVVDALIRRRAAEKSLFLLPPAGYVPAPSPVLPPQIDYVAVAANSRERAVRMTVTMDGETAVATPEAEDGLQSFVAVQPDASPITVAAEVVSAKLQALTPADEAAPDDAAEPESAPDAEPAEREPELDFGAFEPEVLPEALEPDVVEPETRSEADDVDQMPEVPAADPLLSTQDSEEDSLSIPPVSEEASTPVMDFISTPSVDLQLTMAPAETKEPETPTESPTAEEQSSKSVTADAEPPAVATEDKSEMYGPSKSSLAAMAGLSRKVYGADKKSHAVFKNDSVKPINLRTARTLALGVFGLVAFAFAIVWGLSTSYSGGGAVGPHTISWIVGIIGVGCIIAAFYLLVSQLGGSED